MADQWLIWCGTNAEQDAIAAALGSECVSIYGSLSLEEKIEREEEWRLGKVRVLVTKPSIMGWGVNWQHCARMIFVGLSDSFEAYFQCIRRCYRFGQMRPVKVYIVLAEPERPIYENVIRKEQEAEALAAELIAHVKIFEREEILAINPKQSYRPGQQMELPGWLS